MVELITINCLCYITCRPKANVTTSMIMNIIIPKMVTINCCNNPILVKEIEPKYLAYDTIKTLTFLPHKYSA